MVPERARFLNPRSFPRGQNSTAVLFDEVGCQDVDARPVGVDFEKLSYLSTNAKARIELNDWEVDGEGDPLIFN